MDAVRPANEGCSWNLRWHDFRFLSENCVFASVPSPYELRIVWNLISQYFCTQGFHFWSYFSSIGLSDGEKKLPVSPKVKILNLSVTQDCVELRFFWQQIRNLRKKLRLWRRSWDKNVFSVGFTHPNLVLAEILFLLLVNSRQCFANLRHRIRKIQGRKYLAWNGIWFFFDPMWDTPFI